MNLQQRLTAKRTGKLYGFLGGFHRVYPIHHADDGSIVCDLHQLSGLREYKFADEILGLRHIGWFHNWFQDSAYRGQVWRLPARNGAEQFLAGYVDSDGDRAIIEPEAFDCERDAARRADHMAERDAEQEREHSERWHAAQECSEKRDAARLTLRESRSKARAMIQALREQGHIVPSLCTILRERIAEHHAAMRDAIASIAQESEKIAELGMAGEF